MPGMTVARAVGRSVESFFLVIVQGRTWTNLLYLVLAMPLGIAYFTFLATGLALGVGLSITIVGIPLLLAVLLAWRALTALERGLAVALTGVSIAPAPLVATSPRPGAWSRIRATLGDGLTWRGLVHLLLRLPLGIVVFTLTVAAVAVVGSLLSAPWTYRLAHVDLGILHADDFAGSVICFAAGALLLPLCLHALNGLAHALGLLARVMTGPSRPRRAPAPPAPDALPAQV